jgi:hypothetical protein
VITKLQPGTSPSSAWHLFGIAACQAAPGRVAGVGHRRVQSPEAIEGRPSPVTHDSGVGGVSGQRQEGVGAFAPFSERHTKKIELLRVGGRSPSAVSQTD